MQNNIEKWRDREYNENVYSSERQKQIMADTEKILQTLAKDFPNPKSELNFNSPFELLVAVILSAQCTDKRVNKVTPALFALADTPQQMAELPTQKIEELIHSCGFYHSKASYLKEMSQDLISRFNGVVPSSLDELRSLKGVGRKTANVVYAVAFGGNAIAVDTHVFRVSNRLGIANAKSVLETEKQLMQAIPENQWADSHHYILLHGRYVCKAQHPLCEKCSVQSLCEFYKNQHKDKPVEKNVELPDCAMLEVQRCLKCKNPLCASGCPIHYNVPKMMDEVKQGDYENAVKTIGHIFPEVCGYVCPMEKQCKGYCVLNKKGQPISVGVVERHLLEKHYPVICKKSDELNGLKIAVVGGGVSGLTFAEKCFGCGADVTVFEKNQLLNTLKSIPNFRLPKAALDRIVSAVESSGIKIQKRAVDSQMLNKLSKDYDVVYLACGMTVARKLNVEGENLVTVADEFLRGNSFGNAIIVGGGNTAMDCARLNASKGGKSVVAYRRTRNDMPSFEQEVTAAEQEGVEFNFNLAPLSVEKDENGLQVTFARTISDGRNSLTLSDERVTMRCDILVAATGNTADKEIVPSGKALSVNSDGCFEGNIYAGGDVAGKSLVAEAVADGLTAFRGVLKKYKR